MSWNYRVLVFPDGDEEYMETCEVYYDIDSEPNGYGKGDKRLPKVYEKED